MSTTPSPVFVKPYRAIVGTGAPLIADAVIEEAHNDEMVMTDQPVQAGAAITDHAYKLPSELNLTYAWTLGSSQNSTQDLAFLKTIYQTFLGLQANRTLVTVYTGKRNYTSMLVRTLSETTDKQNENSMTLRVGLREVLIATVSTTQGGAPMAQQSIPQKTSPTVDQGTQSLQTAPNFNALDQIMQDFGTH